MELPDSCSFARTKVSEIDANEMERSQCCRRLGWYWLDSPEEPLCRSRQTEEEAYRFSWRSSFHGNVCVHVGRNGQSIRLRWHAPWAPPTSALLSQNNWNDLQKAIGAANFWSLKSDPDLIDGFDGALWLVEGRHGRIFHAVQCRSPGAAIRNLGRLLFVLAGPPLGRIDPY